MRAPVTVVLTIAAVAGAGFLASAAVGNGSVVRASPATCMPGSSDPNYCEPPRIDGKPVTGQSNTTARAMVSTRVARDLLVAFVRSDSPSTAGNSSGVAGG